MQNNKSIFDERISEEAWKEISELVDDKSTDVEIGEITKGQFESLNVYELTLSELIEACGAAFIDLRHNQLGDLPWYACGRVTKYGNGITCTGGNSPKEATANLYLSITNKT